MSRADRQAGAAERPSSMCVTNTLIADLQVNSTLNDPVRTDHTLHLRMASVPVQALVDTGAMISCISHNLLNKIPNKCITKVTPRFEAVKGVGGHIHRVLSCVRLPFVTHGQHFTHTFHVLDGHHSLILGMDFLEPKKAQIDLASNRLSLEGNIILPLGPLSDQSSLVRTTSTQVIPPYAVSCVQVRVSRSYEEPILIEPTQSMLDSGKQCQVVATLGQPREENSPLTCRVVNRSKTHVTLPAGFTVGIARRLSPAQVMRIVEDSPDVVSLKQTNQFKPKVVNPELSVSDTRKMEDFLTANSDVFALDMSQLGCTHRMEHTIDTGDAPPKTMRFYRASPKVRQEIDDQIGLLLEQGFIEPSTSEWTSPVVLVKKKDGSFRFAVDYRQLNAVTRPMNFPLPRLEDIWDAIGESHAKIYSVIDLASGFWQMPVAQNSREKTSFVTQTGQFQWTRMPFGLRNAPISFQKLMSQVFSGLTYKTVIVFMDDIICFSRDVNSHIRDLSQVFDRLRSANLRAKPSKCVFGANSVKYLGHILSSTGILPDPTKTKVIDNFPVPRNQKHVRSFLGIANYYRRFIPGYSTIASPLTKLLCKNVDFVWTETCDKVFREIKSALVKPPLLAFPDMREKFLVTTDASQSAIGFILSQKDENGREHPISYGGRSLRGAELKYGIPQLECLAIVEAVKVFHPYLVARPFTVITDHRALQFLKNIKDENNKLARWAIALQGYDYEIVYKKGATNTNADGLSRRPYDINQGVEAPDDTIPGGLLPISPVSRISPMLETDSEHLEVVFDYLPSEQPLIGQCTPVDCLPYVPTTQDSYLANVPEAQRSCPQLGRLYTYLDSGELPTETAQAKRVILESDQYVLDQDHMYHIFYPRSRGIPRSDRMIKQLAIPVSLRTHVLAQYHDGLMGGAHQGQDRTYHTIRSKYYWPGMYQDVGNYVRGCDSCQRAKRNFHFHPAPIQPMPIVDRFDRWHIDFLGPFRPAKDKSRYVLLVVDSFSRWCEAFPTVSQDAVTVANILYKEIFTRFGAPRSLVSDRGRQFMSHLVKALCTMFQVQKVNTSPYHPQTNATCERLNSSLEQALRAYCGQNQEEWPRYIPGILMAFRATPCTRSTEYSPYYLLFGRNMTTPLDSIILPREDLPPTAKSYVNNLLENLDVARKTAVSNITHNTAPDHSRHDSKAKDPPFFVGQMVMLRDHHIQTGESSKLHLPYRGPYYIVDKGPTPTYRLREAKTHKVLGAYVHANRLKPYSPSEDRRYTALDSPQLSKEDGPNVQSDTPITTPAPPPNDSLAPQPSSSGNQPEPNTSADSHADSESGNDMEVQSIIRASRYQGRKVFLVRIVGKSGSIWLNDEDVPEVVKRHFYINKTMTGKKRKREHRQKSA